MKKAYFKGYLLEVVVAYLMQNSGYKVITAPLPGLKNKSNGLNIIGRGGYHQIDVLGELNWIIPFSNPTRLITEAKFYTKPVGIDVVRSQIGILQDINQNVFSIRKKIITPIYSYKSAIFSASGFSENAIDLALAHHIQLVDLSYPGFDYIKNTVENLTDNIFGNRDKIENGIEIIKEIRGSLFEGKHSTIDLGEIISLENTTLVGMGKGGILLFLMVENINNFLEWSKKGESDIEIHWDRDVEQGKKWELIPHNKRDNPFSLSFNIPSHMYQKIFTSNDVHNESLYQKDIHFETISVYHKDKVINLKYDRRNLR